MSLAADPDEHLENGAGLATPDGDNLLLDGIRGMYRAYADIAEDRGGRTATAGPVGLADARSPVPFANWAIALAPIPSEDVARAVSDAREFHAGSDNPWMFCSAWPIDDLAAHGLQRIGYPPFMVRPSTVTSAVPDTGLRIIEVDSPTLADEFEQTIAEAYPIPAVVGAPDSVLPHTFPARGWRFFIGYEGDRAVGTSAGWIGPHDVHVEMISVRGDCRGKGYGAALTMAPVSCAPEVPSVLIASDDGLPVYRKLGFVPLVRFGLWMGMPG
jgi:GNAT superfamily N-acetyltransferase